MRSGAVLLCTDAERVCGELLIFPESAIRHTQDSPDRKPDAGASKRRVRAAKAVDGMKIR